MPNNAQAIADLEASKKTLEDQCNAATGATFLKLLTSIQHIADEVGALETSTLATAAYVPQTDAFKAVTSDAKAFVATLNNIKTIFAAVGTVAQAIDKVLSYIK